MNDFGNLATQIVTYDFPDDTGSYPVSYVSGWLEANIGELSLLLNEDYLVDATGAIYVDTSTGLNNQEIDIFKKLYEIHYYDKSSRTSLRTAAYSTSTDWIVLKEGDTTIQRQNKNSVAKTYNELSASAREDLKDLVFNLNRLKSGPRQVFGADAIPSYDAFSSDVQSVRS